MCQWVLLYSCRCYMHCYMQCNPAGQCGGVTSTCPECSVSLVGGATVDRSWVPFKKLSLWPVQSHSARLVEHSGAQQTPSGQHGTHTGPQLPKAAGLVHSPCPEPQHEAHVWGRQGEIQEAQVCILWKYFRCVQMHYAQHPWTECKYHVCV